MKVVVYDYDERTGTFVRVKHRMPMCSVYAVDENENIACPIDSRSDCERRMEAAMRAMEPYVIPKTGVIVTTDRAYPDAVTQWEAVKRECWVNP